MDPQRQIAAPGAFTAAGLQSSRRPRLWPASWRRVATPWMTGRVTRPAFWGRADDSETVPARYANSARDHGLDGLRGIAIVLVLVGHTNLAFPFAATVGVTLFFVLSGYLITRILLERPPLRTFYWRRLARLAPALVSVVVVVAVVSALRGDANTLVGALVSLTYVSNWLPSMGVDLGSMGHTWSLAVEEQFYVFWPLALFAIPRIRPVLVGLIVTIMVIRVVSGQHDPTEFRTTLRADALLLGCLLAMVTWRPSGALAFAAAAVVETLAVTRFEARGLGWSRGPRVSRAGGVGAGQVIAPLAVGSGAYLVRGVSLASAAVPVVRPCRRDPAGAARGGCLVPMVRGTRTPSADGRPTQG